MNTVNLIGRAGKDPEIKYFESGSVKTSISMAVDRYNGKDKEKTTDWFDLEAWGKTAEILGEYVKKGNQFGITGNLEFQTWEKDGEKRSKVIIKIDRLDLLGNGGKGESVGAAPGEAKGEFSAKAQAYMDELGGKAVPF